MSDATFACPDLTTFAQLDELGLEATGQRLEPDRAVLACRVVEPDGWCRRCGCQGAPPGHGDPGGRTLFSARRTLCTGADLLTEKQAGRPGALFADDAHVEVEATWGIYQQMVAAYREPARPQARPRHDGQAHRVPAPRRPAHPDRGDHARPDPEQKAADVLAYFDRPGTSNGPTEAINGRLEHLRGSALGFRNLTNYIARSLLETGGFRPRLHPGS